MKPARLLLAGALLALALPLAAAAQDMPGGGPPPEVRAQMEKLRTDAKTAAFNDLSADHRAKVQAIANQVEGGSLSREDGASQIDAILTPDESKAVLAEQKKMRDQMRQTFANMNGGNGGGGYAGHGGGQRGNRQPDAGRFLLMLSITPQDRPQ